MGNYLEVTRELLFKDRLHCSDIQVLGTVKGLNIAVDAVQESNQLGTMTSFSRSKAGWCITQVVNSKETIELLDDASNRRAIALNGGAR